MDDMQAGKIIRNMRKEEKLTMIDFAKKINISQPTLSRIESGHQEITFSLLEKICGVFDISMSDFFRTLEGKNELKKINLSEEDKVDTEIELDTILTRMISSLPLEQKKGLYTLLLPYSKD